MNNNFKTKTGIILHGVNLELGERYSIVYGGRGKFINVKLIQVTPFGYNFLDEETNRCILKQHLYVPLKIREKYNTNKKFFLISDKLFLCKKVEGVNGERYNRL